MPDRRGIVAGVSSSHGSATDCFECEERGVLNPSHSPHRHVIAGVEDGATYELILSVDCKDVDWDKIIWWRSMELCIEELRAADVEVLGMRRVRSA